MAYGSGRVSQEITLIQEEAPILSILVDQKGTDVCSGGESFLRHGAPPDDDETGSNNCCVYHQQHG